VLTLRRQPSHRSPPRLLVGLSSCYRDPCQEPYRYRSSRCHAAKAAEAKRLEDEARRTTEAHDQELAAKEAANATLHTQAIAILNIKVLVPVTLEKPTDN
jgi:hypothetical protein